MAPFVRSAARSGLIVLLLNLIWASFASAVPVVFFWEAVVSEIGGTNIPGVDALDPVYLQVSADNGGSDLLSQTWRNADIISATLSAGAYSATYFPPTGFADPVFQTDGAGGVSYAREVFASPLNPANFDSLGGSLLPSQARNLIGTSLGSGEAFLNWPYPTYDTWDHTQWTVAVIPEPSTILLLGLGLVVLGTRRRASPTR